MKKTITLVFIVLVNYFVYSQCNVIYVTPTGSSPLGTKTNPTNLLNGLNMAIAGDHIKLSIGTYTITSTISNLLKDSLTIEGGFDDGNNWTKTSLAGATTIQRTNASVISSGTPTARICAFQINGLTGFRFQDLTIQVDNAPASSTYGVSVYGIYLNGCSNYNIVRCQVITGDASKGGDGASGADGLGGSNGFIGEQGYDDDRFTNDGGAGGAGATGNAGGIKGNGYSSGNSGPGGNGGAGTNSTSYRNGGAGGGGGGGGNGDNDGGYGGAGGSVASQLPCFAALGVNSIVGIKGDGNSTQSASSLPCTSWSGGDGNDGNDGNDGCNGATGSVGSVGAFWNAGGQGTTGTEGQGGQGGSGGGGGGGQGNCFPCPRGSGAGGGGGGGGGQGGTPGTGGYGGGSSYGIYLYNNGVNGNIVQSSITVGSFGSGGVGGIGGSGGVGGNGANGGTVNGDSEVGCGGDGGDGGNGGKGGDGGSGSSGQSLTIYVNGTSLITQDVGFNLASQPVIVVEEKFCAGDSVEFSALANGLWTFGDYSKVVSATGSNVATVYTQGGRKNIGYNGQNYAGFSYISILSPSLANAGIDSIACGAITLYADSVITGSGLWSPITPGVTVSNPTAHNSPVTLVNGLNELEWVVSYGSCCPPTRDTVRITLNTPPTDPVSIFTLTDTICYGDTARLIVTGGSLGTDGIWTWYKDSCSGTPVGFGDTVVFPITSNRTYYVRAESSCGNTVCVSKALTVNPISVAADSIISSADTLCRYDSVILTAMGGALLPGDEWNWYESSCGGIYVGTGTSIVVAPVNNATYFVRGEGVSCKATPCVSKIIYVKGAVVSIIPYDTICGVLQPIVLNNANPLGGVYSGTGVSNGTFDPVVADYGNHVITYTYTDQASGCVQALYDTLVVSSACADIEKVLVVNTFSPNGDGRNDTWNLNLGNYSKSSVTIFNKWGTKIYESKERIIQWDGTSNGKPLPSGSYFYVIEIDNQEPYTGSITIVK